MKKSAFIALIFGLILTGCSASYKGPNILTIHNDSNGKWKINKKSEFATIFVSQYTGVKVFIDLFPALIIDEEYRKSPPILLANAKSRMFLKSESIKPIKIEYGESCHKYIKKYRRDKMILKIAAGPKVEYPYTENRTKQSDKYQFDTAKVYLTTSSQTYHLQLIDSTGKPLNDRIDEMKPYDVNYFYHLPVICEQLDGASFEISGIYKNGVELPPIKFQISLFEQDPRLLFKQDY